MCIIHILQYVRLILIVLYMCLMIITLLTVFALVNPHCVWYMVVCCECVVQLPYQTQFCLLQDYMFSTLHVH